MFEIDPEYVPLRNPSSSAGISGRLRQIYQRLNLKWILIFLGIGIILAVLLGIGPADSSNLQRTINDSGQDRSGRGIKVLQSQVAVSVSEKAIPFEDAPNPVLQKSHPNFKAAKIPTSESDKSVTPDTISPEYISDKPSLWNGTFRFVGEPSATTKVTAFGPLVPSKSEVLKVELVNVTVDAVALSADLDNCVNLQTLILSNVYISGEFQRVTLPSLETFILRQLPSPGESKEDYQEAPKLKSRLFFDKTPSQNWDVAKDVGNLETEIEFTLGGVTLLKISPSTEEIVLNVPFCQSILQGISWTLSTLTLTSCNVTTSSIPTNLLYFNVYRVWILNGGNFSTIIKAFTRITDFYAQIPGEVVNLSDFPPTLTTLTVVDTELDSDPEYRSTILNLTVGYLFGPKVLDCIEKTMGTVQRVAFFGVPDESDASVLLQKLFLNTSAHWIIVEDFARNPKSNFPIQQWVEEYLGGIGVPQESTNFIITANRNKVDLNSPSRTGRALSPYETDYYHYLLLGWYKVTTYAAYSEIQSRKLANLKVGG